MSVLFAYISKGAKIDFLSFVMRPLLVQLIIGFFSFFAVAVYSTSEAKKASGTPLKQSIFLDVYGSLSSFTLHALKKRNKKKNSTCKLYFSYFTRNKIAENIFF